MQILGLMFIAIGLLPIAYIIGSIEDQNYADIVKIIVGYIFLLMVTCIILLAIGVSLITGG